MFYKCNFEIFKCNFEKNNYLKSSSKLGMMMLLTILTMLEDMVRTLDTFFEEVKDHFLRIQHAGNIMT